MRVAATGEPRRRRPARGGGGVLVAAALAACAGAPAGPEADPTTTSYSPELEVDLATMTRTASGLYLQDLVEGVGRLASRGDLVRINYIGWLPDGSVVDTSVGGDPYVFRLGSGEVIRAWEEGIVGMKVGGRRRLVVRPGLGYGARGRGDVPPNTVLVFDLQLVDVN